MHTPYFILAEESGQMDFFLPAMIIWLSRMKEIEIISFDAEGTLVTPDFSCAIWREAIPALYAQKKGLNLAEAKNRVYEQYDKIGDQRIEWYDIEYWFSYLDIGSSESAIKSCLDRISYYPEVIEVLSFLAGRYKLIIASGTPMKLLHHLLRDIRRFFSRIFSSVSHYGQLKSPDFYLRVCKEMGVNPNQVVHIGDNWQFDFLNARQAGVNALYLDRSVRNHEGSLSDLTQLKSILGRAG